uniref:RNA-directed DNA polymerase n=1 Tax=Cacopsylla melanoneura TaxID=428564 RepID=A0A8D8QBB9_9HEMI
MSLSINFSKTTYMTLSINQSGQPIESNIEVYNSTTHTYHTITKTTKSKYLGVIVDQHIKWKEHIDHIRNKLRHLTYIFSNLRRICSMNHLRQLYFGLAQSIIQYCLVAWGGTYQNIIEPLRRSLNILLRVILKKDRYFHSNDLYQIFNVPTLNDIYTYKITFFSLKHSHNWILTDQTYNTRNSNNIQTIQIHKTITMKHFIEKGAQIYNLLPDHIRTLTNSTFIKKAVSRKEMVKRSQQNYFHVQIFTFLYRGVYCAG